MLSQVRHKQKITNVLSISNIRGMDYGQSVLYHIFVPTTPNPTSGVFIIIPKKDAIEADLTVEEGLKAVISGGLLAPEQSPLDN